MLSLDIQEKHWPRLKTILEPFLSDGNILDAQKITLAEIEIIARDGFLWNWDVGSQIWTEGRSTREKLVKLIYFEPVLQHRLELYVAFIGYLEKSFLTGLTQTLLLAPSTDGDQKYIESDESIELIAQFSSWINSRLSKLKTSIFGKDITQKSKYSNKINVLTLTEEFMTYIRKYPALLHYIMQIDVEQDLDSIIDITGDPNVAILLYLLEGREKHNCNLRQDLSVLLKDGDGLVDYLVNPELTIVDAANIIDQSEAGEFKSRVSKNCRDMLKLYLRYSLQCHKHN